MTSREFNQDTSRAKKAAASGPVFITDRGAPAHVLLSIEEYRALQGQAADVDQETIGQSLAQPGGGGDFDFDPPKLNLTLRPAVLE